MDECISSFTSGDIFEDGRSNDGAVATSKCKAETIKACSDKGAMEYGFHSTDLQPSGVPSHHDYSKSLGTLPSSFHGFNPAQLSSGPEHNLAVLGKQLEILQMLCQQLSLAIAVVQPRSYDKGGYSVVISNGCFVMAMRRRVLS